jgi:hypothetical protein
MKKILIILLVGITLLMAGCSSVKIDTEKNKVEKSQLKEPYKLMDEILIRECILPDWYENETPVSYLKTRQIMKPGGKEEVFLDGLKTKENITDEDVEEFNKITQKFLSKLERKYKLKDENIKNTKALVQELVIGYNVLYPTMSKHLMTDVATEKERDIIIELNNKPEKELTDKDRTKLRKILAAWLKRDNFYDAESLYSAQVSEATVRLEKLSKKKELSKLELNNLNAKAMEIAFPELISQLKRWDK